MTMMLVEWVRTSAFLMLTVLALRAVFGRRVSARMRYALWAVVLVRLLVPVQLFTSPIAGTSWVLAETHTEQNVVYQPVTSSSHNQVGPDVVLALGGQDGLPAALSNFPQAPSAPAIPDPPEPPDLSDPPEWLRNLGWVWLAGSAAVLLVFTLSNLRFFWKLRRERAAMDGADCPLRVYTAAGLPSPCLFGIFRPAVYVTPETAADPDMLRHVLAHEYTHYRQGDHIWSLLRCAVLAAHWWNPLVWVSARLSQRDAELACDEGALKRLGDGERAGYGNTLLALVTAKPGPGDLFQCATTMAGDKKSLKERISRIACAPKRWLWAAVAAVLATALACACAFGQAAGGTEPDPAPSTAPADSLDVEVEIAFSHVGTDLASSFYVPEDVLDAAKRWVADQFAWDAPGGVMLGVWQEYNPETDEWETNGSPNIRAHFDRVRINAMMGPWPYTLGNVDYEIWQMNYEYHTNEPDVVRDGKFLHMAGGRYLDEEGWMCPTYQDSTYLIFKTDAGGASTFVTSAVISDCDPYDSSSWFYEEIAAALNPEPGRDPLPDDAFEVPRTVLFYEPDLNRNGVKETVKTADITDEDGNVLGQRVGVFEGDELIWWDEGWYAHAGYNAIFACTVGGKDYLLRYNPVMYQGIANYSYKLFTLENGVETWVERESVDFNINVGSPNFTGRFNPEEIHAFVAKVNNLLASSKVLMVTDDYLIEGINKGGLVENLWWLDSWEPVFVRDEYTTLYGNLCAYLAAMEPYNMPTVRALDEYHTRLQISYHGMKKEFDGYWDEMYQPNPDCQVVDLNGDGKDEIVAILNTGHGTGACTFDLHVFDAATLEPYDTSALTDDIIRRIERTGDEDNFYLSGLGMEKVTIARSIFGDVPWLADTINMGDIVYYTLGEGGKITCTIGCDASGTDTLYCGYLYVELRFDGSGFQVAGCTYVQDPEYGGE